MAETLQSRLEESSPRPRHDKSTEAVATELSHALVFDGRALEATLLQYGGAGAQRVLDRGGRRRAGAL